MTRETHRLIGRVLGDDGRPVAGAEVYLVPTRHTTTSSEDGTFAFEGLDNRRYRVAAIKDDYYAWPVIFDPERPIESVLLSMRLGATLIVHAYADRAPVVGARLFLNGLLRGTTDANGTAVVHGLMPRTYHGFLLADGWEDERLIVSVREDPGGVDERFMTLHHASRIEGLVRDSRGNAVGDAMLRAWKPSEGSLMYEARSDADGRWHFYARAGKYGLMAATMTGGQSAQTSFECDGQTSRTDIVIEMPAAPVHNAIAGVVNAAKRLISGERPTRIAGVVVNAAGEPVMRATVRVLTTSSESGGSMTYARAIEETDANGRFDLEDLDDDEYDVLVEAPTSQTRRHDKRTRHRVKTGDLDLKIGLPSSGTIEGRALLDGVPLQYFGASLTEPRVSGGMPVGIRTSDGSFLLPHIEAGTWRLALFGPGTRLKVVDDIVVDEGATVRIGDVNLERGQQVTGYVRDASGKPISGARVVIGHWVRLQSDERSKLERALFGKYEVATGLDGAYRFDGIDAHQMTMRNVHIWATHPALGASLIRELPPSDLSIDFVLFGAGHVNGTIEHVRGGRPTVVAVRPDEPGRARVAFPNKAGDFHFEDLPVGDYVIGLDVGGEKPAFSTNVTVFADRATDVKLTMASSSVHLTVRVPGGRGKDLILEPTTDGAGIGGRVRSIMGGSHEDRCSLDFVQPGGYRASLDGKQWKVVVVTAEPSEQTIDLTDLSWPLVEPHT